jgi:hypothetical protein
MHRNRPDINVGDDRPQSVKKVFKQIECQEVRGERQQDQKCQDRNGQNQQELGKLPSGQVP